MTNVSTPSNAVPQLTLSIVSHGQAALIRLLLEDLARLAGSSPIRFETLITLNLPEAETLFLRPVPYPFPVRFIHNATPKGFGGNHNAAFDQATGQYFAIVNPDIRLNTWTPEGLLQLFSNPAVGAVAPVVLSMEGKVEDSVRRFPTLARLARRSLLRQRAPDYVWQDTPIRVDWVAGMFVVFRPEAYRAVRGFDDRRFFMYMEDVDICDRLGRAGWQVLLQPAVSVIHDARRASRKSLKHMRWHLTSAARYLTGL